MEKDLQRTKKYDKDMIKLIAYKSIEFPVETKNQININVFVYENKQVHPVHLSENRFEVHSYGIAIANIWTNFASFLHKKLQ